MQFDLPKNMHQHHKCCTSSTWYAMRAAPMHMSSKVPWIPPDTFPFCKPRSSRRVPTHIQLGRGKGLQHASRPPVAKCSRYTAARPGPAPLARPRRPCPRWRDPCRLHATVSWASLLKSLISPCSWVWAPTFAPVARSLPSPWKREWGKMGRK